MNHALVGKAVLGSWDPLVSLRWHPSDRRRGTTGISLEAAAKVWEHPGYPPGMEGRGDSYFCLRLFICFLIPIVGLKHLGHDGHQRGKSKWEENYAGHTGSPGSV